MIEQLIAILITFLAFGAVIAGAAYVFSITAEPQPQRKRRPTSSTTVR